MSNGPSIIPGAPEDYYIVLNHYGRFGTTFAETDLDRANYETTIADLISGQHSDPLRVIRFNPETNRSEDVSHVIAQEILRRLARRPQRAAVTRRLHGSPCRPGSPADVAAGADLKVETNMSSLGVASMNAASLAFKSNKQIGNRNASRRVYEHGAKSLA